MSTNPKDYVRRSDGNVAVKVAELAEGAFSGASIGCLREDFTTSDGFDLTDVDERNWCRDIEAAINRAVLGGRTIELSGSLDMIPSDASFEDMVGWYKAKETFLLQIVYSDDQTNETTMTDLYEVVLTQWDRTAAFEGTAYVTFTIRVNAVRDDMVIATSGG